MFTGAVCPRAAGIRLGLWLTLVSGPIRKGAVQPVKVIKVEALIEELGECLVRECLGHGERFFGLFNMHVEWGRGDISPAYVF